jgi:predicted TIM-barrel fold metal-dependent hydrolase
MGDVAPSQVCAEHFWVSMIVDRYAIAKRHLIGLDNLMWKAHFPHNDSNFPDSPKLLEEALADVPDDEAHQIAELNARNFYDFH